MPGIKDAAQKTRGLSCAVTQSQSTLQFAGEERARTSSTRRSERSWRHVESVVGALSPRLLLNRLSVCPIESARKQSRTVLARRRGRTPRRGQQEKDDGGRRRGARSVLSLNRPTRSSQETGPQWVSVEPGNVVETVWNPVWYPVWNPVWNPEWNSV